MTENIIYNGFNLKYFNFEERECQECRERFSLIQKPGVYISNCQIAKGVVETSKSLKDVNVDSVTRGKNIDLPCRHLYLTYRDYLLLLKVSSVLITMSQFKEVWCRPALETMFYKIPVIASRTGGMAELLKGGGQMTCDDFSKLPNLVVEAIKNSEAMGKRGYAFASQFTIERFENEWLQLVSKIV